MSKPPLAILIPVYNIGRFLRETLESVRRQTHAPDEVIILDNCSTDDTVDIAREFSDLAGFRLAANSENIGGVRNFIAIERLATSNYILWLPGDDVLMPDCIERWHRTVAVHPGLGFYFAGRTLIDENGRDIPRGPPRPPLPEGIIPGSMLIDWMLVNGQPNVVPGTVVNRSAYQAVGGFDVRLRAAFDYDLFMRLAGRGDVHYEPAANVAVREHFGQWSQQVSRRDNFDADVLFDKIDEMTFLTTAQVKSFVEGLCEYARQYYSRPLRDPARTVSEIALERERTTSRFQKWRSSGKPYAKYVRLWPKRILPRLAWFLGGMPMGIRLMHHVLAGSRR